MIGYMVIYQDILFSKLQYNCNGETSKGALLHLLLETERSPTFVKTGWKQELKENVMEI